MNLIMMILSFFWELDYLLLREEFKNLPENDVRDKVKNILVTIGGYDLKT